VRICSALGLDFAIPSALDFLYCLLQRLRWPAVFSVHRGLHKQVVMLAQLLCELSLLSSSCAAYPSSLISSCALCLALSTLRCGLWRDGSPGPSTSPEQYWTASMAQVTGYERDDLREALQQLLALYEHASPEISASPMPGSPEETAVYGIIRHKFSQPRFLNVHMVAPFTPHAGGALSSPAISAFDHSML